MDPVEETIKTYDQVAKEYLVRRVSEDKNVMQLTLDRFISILQPGAKVLDVGCGSGADANYLMSKGFKVVGIDLSENMLKLAKKIAPKAKFLKMDLRFIDFKDQTFDGVWASASLLHIPKNEITGVIVRINKILKQNGILFVALKKGTGENFVTNMGEGNLPGAKRYFAYYSPEEISGLLENNGFKILETGSNTNRRNVWLNFFCKKVPKRGQKHDPIWDLPKLAKGPNKPMGELSEDDKIIYGV